MMRGAVLAHQSGTVEAEHDRESGDGHIVDYVRVGSLEEGRVYRHIRL